MAKGKSFLTTLRHTVFGSTPDTRFITEKERQRNAAMKVGQAEESPPVPARPATALRNNRLNIEDLTPGTLDFNIAIGLPEPDICTLLSVEEFRSNFTVAELRECRKHEPTLFNDMISYANSELESADEEVLLEVASILSGRKRQIDKSRANRKAKVENMANCAKCGKVKKSVPAPVVNRSDGTVAIPESMDDIPPKPLSVTELIRASRNPDSPKSKETLLNVAKGREDAAKSYETFRDREYQERRNRKIAELGPDNDTAPPVLSVTEKIRANRDRKR